MIGNKKVIGVCVSKIQSICNNELLSRLHMLAEPQGLKLIVFNSPADFYNNDDTDIGAKAVYDLINYDLIDCLIIHSESFYNKELCLDMIKNAQSHGTPVLAVKLKNAGCPSIINDYDEGFIQLMDHVIREHGARDTCFIAGRREDDPGSVERIECYKKALKMNGLPFSEEQVDYGDYWNIPAIQATQRILAKRETPPQAIFCANDYMAIAVCKELERHGLKVPDDVIVTGFDGVPEAEYMIPQLTTCKEDFDALAEQTLSLAVRLINGEEVSQVNLNKYRPFFTESCGCPFRGSEPRRAAEELYSLTHESLSHEEYIFDWLAQALEAKDMKRFLDILPSTLLPLATLCMNSDFIDCAVHNKPSGRQTPFSEKMDVMCSQYAPYPPEQLTFDHRQMIPDPERWVNEESVYVLSTLCSGKEVYGYYAIKSGQILTDSYNINRSLNALNVGFNSIVRLYRQRMTLLGLRNAALTDHLTGLPNLQGTTAWFEELSSEPDNHRKCLTVSIYGMPRYKYIYENYGIKEIEEVIKFIGKKLREANVPEAFIGRVADDEFLVINQYSSPEEIPAVINAATSAFFGSMNEYNESCGKDYRLEVNAGCTELYPGWEGTLAAFSKLAGNAMYLNRLNNNVEPEVKKAAKIPMEVYKSFEMLVEKNLFDYHFQPIVDAKTGEIVAYEALMRPHRSVNMAPMEVIETAEQYDRLDDIERATMFNVLRTISEKLDSFKGRKVFINSIPGHFLHGQEYNDFIKKYEKYLDTMVVEITEGSTVSDEELSLIRKINNGMLPIAIDDYGTGHSNIVNLLRYSPQIIKIDRFLVSNIQDDTNKQLFFRSTVEFAAMNDIKVLAEGVETAEELKCVIKLGADYIQGYFTGRPAPEPLDEIDPEIKKIFRQKPSDTHISAG
ncbi:MAG: EAL domain-containing protein [Ruminococcus sp.]|nr:EAL domain-containing protein [Ruminococcus sp.]